jgi:hypothetical protein
MFYILGFHIAASAQVWEKLENMRYIMLIVAVGSAFILYGLRWAHVLYPARSVFDPWHFGTAWRGANSWFWVAALLGYARHYLNFEVPLLRYAVEASYPIYLLHQTIIVLIGYFVIGLTATIGLKLCLIITTSTVLVITTYELVIRRTKAIRYMFGLRSLAAGRPRANYELAHGRP